jgi:alkanesulfonate monooxygenase SsuD/methylene tetrahydromethanopterin reductase-like flavin-dependent oxidoreductase (luciferase family)
MRLGIFNTPYSLRYAAGERTAQEVIEWDLQVVEWADQYGLAEAFFAEHYTIGHEPSPAPDLMIAAAAQRTRSIRLGAAAHLLPYHNPINLAHRLLWLDHMTGGRYIAGFAPGSFPTDAQLFGTGTRNAGMMVEALDIVDAIWTRQPPFKIEGEYWTVDMPAYTEQWGGPHLKALQAPHPPVVITGMQAESPSFKDAGRRGFFPMSQQVSTPVLIQHWDTYSAAAATAGLQPDRSEWRIMRDVIVGDTDEAALALALGGERGRTWGDHILPTFKQVRQRGNSAYSLAPLLTGGEIEPDELTIEWLAENLWIVGSPDTVVEKLARLNQETGGVGTVISFCFDHSQDPEPYRRNLELLGREVMPRIAELEPVVATAA